MGTQLQVGQLVGIKAPEYLSQYERPAVIQSLGQSNASVRYLKPWIHSSRGRVMKTVTVPQDWLYLTELLIEEDAL